MASAHITDRLRRAGTVAKWLVIATIFGLIIRALVMNLPELRRQTIGCNIWYLIASVFLLCIHYLFYALLWHLLTVANQASIPRGQAIVAWFYSMLGKYVPGKVFLWAGRVFYYKRHGRSIKRVTFCFTLEMALQLLAACIIATVVLAQSSQSPLQAYRHAAWLLLIVLAVIVNPRVLQFLVNTVLKWFGREQIVIDMRVRDMAALLLGYLANGFVLGASFYLFVNAFCPLGTEQYLFLTAALLTAGMVGIVSVFAPGGLGVREGALLVALCLIMPQTTAAVIVLAARLWTTAGELLCVAAVFLHDKFTQRCDSRNKTQRAAGGNVADAIWSPRDLKSQGAAGFSPRDSSNTKHRTILVMISLLGVGSVWISTSRYGVGLGPDSTNYIAAARSLAQGQGFLGVDGAPYTHWPPLYATILAGATLFGIDPLDGARYVNAGAFGLIIFLSVHLFFSFLRSTTLAMLGSISILLANPLYGLSTLALSEPVFVVLTILFYVYILRYLRQGRRFQLLQIGLLAALCCLQRYIGVAVVLAGVIVILLCQSNMRVLQRIKHTCVFGMISTTPLAVWLFRNHLLTSSDSEYSPASKITVLESLTQMCETLTSWLVPEIFPLWFRLSAVAVVLGALITAAMILPGQRHARRPSPDSSGRAAAQAQAHGSLTFASCPKRTHITVAGVFVLTYMATVLAISLVIQIAKLNNRILLPTYVFLFLLLLILVDDVLARLRAFGGRGKLVGTIVLGFCALWLMYPLARVGSRTWYRMQNGAGGYSTARWLDSPTMKRLATRLPDGDIYSNSNDAIYIFTTTHAYRAPSKRKVLESFITSMSWNRHNYLVWFNHGRNSYYHPNELKTVLEVEAIEEFPDGGIYRLNRLPAGKVQPRG